MKTAIIVLNYNSEKETEEYVNKIKEYNILDKIIVVDNMSTTIGAYENLKKLKNEKVDVIQSERNGGYSYGNNYGVHYLESLGEKYDNIIISNSDIDVEENAIKKCIKVLNSEKDIGVVAPRMYNGENKPCRRSSWKKRTPYLDMINSTRILEILFLKKLYAGEYSEEDYKKEKLQVEAIAGSFFVIKYDVLKQVNYLDENVFLFYEEDILAHKLESANYKVYSLNDIKFIHYESQTIKKSLNYFKKMKRLYLSKLYYQKQYNKIGKLQTVLFEFLHIIRIIELLIEVPIRKLLKK